MGDELLTLFGLAWAAVFGVVAAAKVKAVLGRRRHEIDVEVVIRAALLHADLRRQSRVDLAHVALALTFDPSVASRIGRIASLAALRDRLEAAIEALPVEENENAGEDEVDAWETMNRRLDPQIRHVMTRAQRKRVLSPDPCDAMTALLETIGDRKDPAPHLRAIFKELRIDAVAWREVGRTGESSADVAGPPIPYREARAPRGDVFVRLWNDDKTTMAFVLAVLMEMFSLSRAEAAYVMLRVHQLGSALIGPYPTDEAARLVAKVGERARSERHPLRLTSEPAEVPKRSRFARWFSRSPAS